jgi:hypothetical protein
MTLSRATSPSINGLVHHNAEVQARSIDRLTRPWLPSRMYFALCIEGMSRLPSAMWARGEPCHLFEGNMPRTI